MALIIGIVAVLIIIFGFLCYKKAPPTEAIVVTGFGLSKPKVVSGKGTFVLPVLQRADKLNMRLLKIDVKTPETGVYHVPPAGSYLELLGHERAGHQRQGQ